MIHISEMEAIVIPLIFIFSWMNEAFSPNIFWIEN